VEIKKTLIEEISNACDLVFVSGPPRSGTTLAHALLCTSNNTNDYVPECSYFTGMLNNFVKSSRHVHHNEDLYGSMDLFKDLAFEQIAFALLQLWRRLDSPEVLCLKDPNLAIHFRWLHQMISGVKYVLIIRPPTETISSQITVMTKQNRRVDDSALKQLCQQLNAYYDLISKLQATAYERTLIIEYQSILDQTCVKPIKDFIPGSSPDYQKLWLSEFTSVVDRGGPWTSPLYGKPASTLKTRADVLTESQRTLVNTMCEAHFVTLTTGQHGN